MTGNKVVSERLVGANTLRLRAAVVSVAQTPKEE